MFSQYDRDFIQSFNTKIIYMLIAMFIVVFVYNIIELGFGVLNIKYIIIASI